MQRNSATAEADVEIESDQERCPSNLLPYLRRVYETQYVRKMKRGEELTLEFLQKNGFDFPLLVEEKTGLGLLVPSSQFTVNDIRACVGSSRILKVTDIETRESSEMTMGEWQYYYDRPNKDKIMNVSTLEFSLTKLQSYVEAPLVVRQIDWIDCIWPRPQKEAQTEPTDKVQEMFFPNVQNCCLMPVKGSYTDFHIDFGGSSVWYHVLSGSLVLWLVPPNQANLKLYQNWALTGERDVFFGDLVDNYCSRISLVEGNTLFLPSGWIYAIYALQNSLVFGGHFLQSYSSHMCIQIANIEETINVADSQRFPLFTEMMWYVLNHYVYVLLGTSYIHDVSNNPAPLSQTYLTPRELYGVKSIVTYLHNQMKDPSKIRVPVQISDPVALVRDVRGLAKQQFLGQDKQLTSNYHILINPATEFCTKRPWPDSRVKGLELKTQSTKQGRGTMRIRCRKCCACIQSDCGVCLHCKGMSKFGGNNLMRKTCMMRPCLYPVFPTKTTCIICNLDGWGLDKPNSSKQRETISSLVKCSICCQSVHPECANLLIGESYQPGVNQVNTGEVDLWKCHACLEAHKCRRMQQTSHRGPDKQPNQHWLMKTKSSK